MADLKIKPEFRDLIPKLTDEEFAQLEANILNDGRVRESITVWNGYIVDGHHRWEIIKRHPEIPYGIEEIDFEDENAAMEWARLNQLGRRNLTETQMSSLRGLEYNQKKAVHGGAREATPEKREMAYSPHGLSDELAKKHNVGHSTIEEDGKIRKGLEIIGNINPNLMIAVETEAIKVPKKTLRKIDNAESGAQKKAVELISEGKINEAEIVLNGDEHILDGLYDNGEQIEFSEDDLMDELNRCFFKAMETMKTTRESYEDLMEDPDINNRIIDKLIELHEAEIADLQEEKK